MSEPDKQQTAVPSGNDSQALPFGPPWVVRTPVFGGTLTSTLSEPAPGRYLGSADFQARSGNGVGAWLDLSTRPAYSIGRYGFNGTFGLGDGGGFRFDAEANSTTETPKYTAALDTTNGYRLNADMLRTPNGRIYGLDAAFPLSPDGNGVATLRVDEPAGGLKFDTRLSFSPGYHLNADFLRTHEGRIYGGDAGFLIGKEGNGITNVRVDEPAGTVQFDTKLLFRPAIISMPTFCARPKGGSTVAMPVSGSVNKVAAA